LASSCLRDRFPRSGAIADTAGVTNLVALGDRIIAADPYFDAFRAAVTTAFADRGGRVSLINDGVYHFAEGEVHCGTQVVRDLEEDR
jgi:hypothetical protein